MTPRRPAPQDATQPTPKRLDRPRARRRWRLALIVLLGVGAYAVMIAGCQRSILFPRHVLPDVTGDRPPAGAERLTRAIDGGDVEAWLLPAPDATPDRPAPLVIFAHGNGELIDYWPPMLRPYTQRGVHVLLVEYRGYGRSAGSPSEAGLVDDFLYFHDAVTRRGDVDADRVVLHGRSVGAGVIAQVAARRKPAGLILESAFTSVADMARRFLVPRFLVRDPMDVRGVLREADYPILLMHGRADTIIPVSHALANHEAAPRSELVLFDGMNHNDPPPTELYWRTVNDFLDACIGPADRSWNETTDDTD